MSKYDEKIIPTLDDVIKPGDLDKAVISDLNSFDDASDDDDGTIELFTDSTTELDDTFDTEFDKLYTDTDSPTEDLALDDALLDTTDDDLALQADSPGDATETANIINDNAPDVSTAAPENDTDISALEETPEQYQVASQVDDASLENALDDNDLSDNHDDLADLIVAESFPQNDAALHASIEDEAHDIDIPANEKPRAYDVASWGEPVVNFDNPEEPAAAPQAEVKTAVTDSVAETATEKAGEAPAKASTESSGKSPDHATAASVAIAADINVGALVDDITKKLMPEIEWKVRMRLREVLDEIFPEKD